MPRYHFNVHNGHSETDRDGMELPNIAEARSQALYLAEENIRASARRAGFGEEWRVEVTDDTDMILFRMDFIIVDAEAAANHTAPL